MTNVALGTDSLLAILAFTLPSEPRSVQAARRYVRTALGCHDLNQNADDVAAVTSELVANAVTHARAEAFDVDVLLLRDDSDALAIVVFDRCPRPPVKREPTTDVSQRRGLVVVDALATRWGWIPQTPGKAVFAVFAKKG